MRGFALGDGKVFQGKLDATLVAIDQLTGEEVWATQVADPSERCSITSAPRYYDGLVITGTSGGVMGTRGRVNAGVMSGQQLADVAAYAHERLRAAPQ